jgi:NTP pyrophosphatase (non-canonical NTP hydrolase)
MDLRDLQSQHATWVKRNFPNATPAHGLLGLIEELGELAHAQLKTESNIRGNEDHEAAIRDSVGDLVIYLSSYCTTVGISLNACVAQAWAEVRARDWVLYPETGRPPTLEARV